MSSTDGVICRMLLDGLKVDFMPDDPKILSFSNRWYPKVLATADLFQLTDELNIQLIKPEYFIATKLEAFNSRGNDDVLLSHDIEDLLNLFDGRVELVDEIKNAEYDVQSYINEEIKCLLDEADFEYAVQSGSNNDADREALLFNRLECCI